MIADLQRSLTLNEMFTIPAWLMPKLLEPFARGDRFHNGSQCLGLGLFITHELSRHMEERSTCDRTKVTAPPSLWRVPGRARHRRRRLLGTMLLDILLEVVADVVHRVESTSFAASPDRDGRN